MTLYIYIVRIWYRLNDPLIQNIVSKFRNLFCIFDWSQFYHHSMILPIPNLLSDYHNREIVYKHCVTNRVYHVYNHTNNSMSAMYIEITWFVLLVYNVYRLLWLLRSTWLRDNTTSTTPWYQKDNISYYNVSILHMIFNIIFMSLV